MKEILEKHGFRLIARKGLYRLSKRLDYSLEYYQVFDRLVMDLSSNMAEKKEHMETKIEALKKMEGEFRIIDYSYDGLMSELAASIDRLGYKEELALVQSLMTEYASELMRVNHVTHYNMMIDDVSLFEGDAEAMEENDRIRDRLASLAVKGLESFPQAKIIPHLNSLSIEYLGSIYTVSLDYQDDSYCFRWGKHLFSFGNDNEMEGKLMLIMKKIEDSLRLKLVYGDLGDGFKRVKEIKAKLRFYPEVYNSVVNKLGYIKLENELQEFSDKQRIDFFIVSLSKEVDRVVVGSHLFIVDKETGKIKKEEVIAI